MDEYFFKIYRCLFQWNFAKHLSKQVSLFFYATNEYFDTHLNLITTDHDIITFKIQKPNEVFYWSQTNTFHYYQPRQKSQTDKSLGYSLQVTPDSCWGDYYIYILHVQVPRMSVQLSSCLKVFSGMYAHVLRGCVSTWYLLWKIYSVITKIGS